MRIGWLGAVLVTITALGFTGRADAQYYGGGGGYVIRCESRDYNDNYCPVNTRGGVRIVNQISRTPCDEGETWGYDRRGIWVTAGCKADFEIGGGGRGYDRPGYGGGYGGDRGYGGGDRITCESRDYRYNYCPVRVRRDVNLVYQTSSAECRFNRSWGYDRGGIWVDRGCAAEFEIR